MDELLVDPAISRQKFDAEVAQVRALLPELLLKGILLLDVAYPKVLVAFAAKSSPMIIAHAVEIDFSNYDVWPPSVRFVDLFTRKPLALGQILPLIQHVGPLSLEDAPSTLVLVQADDPQRPFLCLPGVREYHSHPGHTADSWLLHRGAGEGRLHFLLEKIHEFGARQVKGFAINVAFEIKA